MNEALREHKRSLREEAIIAVTQQLVAARGFTAMTMDDVANEAGISKATLYQHFKSKEELAIAVVTHAMDELDRFVESLNPSLSPLDRLNEAIRFMLAYRFGDSSFDFHDTEASLPMLVIRSTSYLQHERRFVARLVGLLEPVKAEGIIPPHVSTELLARMLFSWLKDITYKDLLRDGRCTLDEMRHALTWMLTGGHG